MAKLKDIASACRLSVTQVSRALAGYSDVSEETRRRVREVADDLGYRSNTMARGLRTGRSGMVAMVMPSQIDASAKELMFELITGISEELAARGIKLILHVVSSDSDLLKAYDELHGSGGIDAFVLVLPDLDDKRISHLLRSGIPFIAHGSDPSHVHPYVAIDNSAVVTRMVEDLAALGHKRIAHLNGPERTAFAKERDAGYLAAMADAGLTDVGRDQSFGEMTPERGARVLRALWSRDVRPTALVLGNTMLARGVYDAASELGIAIPGDLSVLAHDDGLEHYAPASFDPPLGGTSAPLSLAWRKIAQVLSQEGTALGTAGAALIEFAFDPGRSTAVPAGKKG